MRVEVRPGNGPFYNRLVASLVSPSRFLRPVSALLIPILASILCMVGSNPAGAHQGDPNYRSELEGIEPPALSEGLDFTVGNYDDFIALSNRSGKTVVIEGYRGEPYLRFGPDGRVEANRRSPAWFANRDRYGEGEIPASADPDAPAIWKLVSDEGRYAWHDHRSHWMGKGVPAQVVDRSARTEVFGYSIPMRIDGREAALNGTLFWVGSGGGPPLWPFLLLGVIAVGGAGLIALGRRRSRPTAEPDDTGA